MSGKLTGAVAACFIATGALAATGTGSPAVTGTSEPRFEDSEEIQLLVAQAAGELESCKRRWRRMAPDKGISLATFDRAFQGVEISDFVLGRDRKQAEFSRPVWVYLETALAPERVTIGKRKRRELKPLLDRIEAEFGVDTSVLLAIWAQETAFGGFMGKTPIIQSLATLACDGRRKDFAEEQLFFALQILESGDVTPERMVGSWAGAMGHVQFIPSSYVELAVDYNGDGRRDIWEKDPTDALASAANFLRARGWKRGLPWGVEVRLPEGFNHATTGVRSFRTSAFWAGRGVTKVDGAPLPNFGAAGILTPAGADGPAFMISDNFKVIKRYNSSDLYAFAIGHLGDLMFDRPPVQAAWPKAERALARSERIELQELLMARGFDTGGADGVIGTRSIAAVREIQRAWGLKPDGYPTPSFLERLRKEK